MSETMTFYKKVVANDMKLTAIQVYNTKKDMP